MLVLGIDPGLSATGYGIVAEDAGRLTAVEFGVIKSSSKSPLHERLLLVANALGEVIEEHNPDCASVERVFVAVNVKTALLLGHVRGAILTELGRRELPVHEYSALEIKRSVVGYGRAQKQQVAEMTRALLGLKEPPKPADAADALAAAVCHLHSRSRAWAAEGK